MKLVRNHGCRLVHRFFSVVICPTQIHDDRSADHFWLPPFRSSSAPRIPMTIGPPIISVVICPSTPIPIMCHLLCIWPKRWLQRSQLLSLHQQHQLSLHQQRQLTTFLCCFAMAQQPPAKGENWARNRRWREFLAQERQREWSDVKAKAKQLFPDDPDAWRSCCFHLWSMKIKTLCSFRASRRGIWAIEAWRLGCMGYCTCGLDALERCWLGGIAVRWL